MLLVIDNFLKDPHSIREFALAQKYETAEEASIRNNVNVTFPAVRTDSVLDLYYEYGKDSILTVLERLKDYIGDRRICTSSYFQVCSAKDKSWIHKDQSALFAGVLYLSPDAPYNAGTILYDEEKNVTDVVANKFNRLVLYNGDVFHKSNEYFGDTLENSRMTQVFFVYPEVNEFVKNVVY